MLNKISESESESDIYVIFIPISMLPFCFFKLFVLSFLLHNNVCFPCVDILVSLFLVNFNNSS